MIQSYWHYIHYTEKKAFIMWSALRKASITPPKGGWGPRGPPLISNAGRKYIRCSCLFLRIGDVLQTGVLMSFSFRLYKIRINVCLLQPAHALCIPGKEEEKLVTTRSFLGSDQIFLSKSVCPCRKIVTFSSFPGSLGTKHPWVKEIQVCYNKRRRPFPGDAIGT